MSQAAARVLDLMTAVVHSGEPTGLMDLVEKTGIDKSTASRLLGLLAERGFIARYDGSKRYQVGPELVAMLTSFSARLDIRTVCAPHLVELRDASGETVSLHLHIGGRRVCIDGLESDHAVRRVVPLGESLPLYRGPSGKVILAQLEQRREGEQILAAAAEAGVDTAALRKQLASIRAAGFALTVGDRTPGVRAASACVAGQQGPIASITVAGPADRWAAASARRVVPRIVDAARQVSVSMGGASE